MSGAAFALDMPAPPCEGPPTPAYPSALDAPRTEVWLDHRDLENWHASACLGWQDKPATALIAVAGRFQHDGTADELLMRLGAISQYTSISYWSWSRKRWRPLFEKSVALSSAVRTAVRRDFKPDELRKGVQVFALQDESGPLGEVIQRVSVIDRTADRIEIGITNVTPARVALLRLFEPGGSNMRLWIERESEGRWTYYSLTRLSGSAMLARPAMQPSYVNRADAMYRYLIGAMHRQDTD